MSIDERIAAILGTAPNDLVAFYDSACVLDYPDARVHILPLDRAESYTASVSRISIVGRLGLWFLDDANDSNPYAYISRGPCSGMVIHFSHDDTPRICFSSLKRFVEAMDEVGRSDRDIDDLKPEAISIPLADTIRTLACEDSEDATYLIIAYLPICSSLDQETERALLESEDFFVREALAVRIAHRPAFESAASAERLANDRHPQVAKAGKRASAAIRQKSRG